MFTEELKQYFNEDTKLNPLIKLNVIDEKRKTILSNPLIQPLTNQVDNLESVKLIVKNGNKLNLFYDFPTSANGSTLVAERDAYLNPDSEVKKVIADSNYSFNSGGFAGMYLIDENVYNTTNFEGYKVKSVDYFSKEDNYTTLRKKAININSNGLINNGTSIEIRYMCKINNAYYIVAKSYSSVQGQAESLFIFKSVNLTDFEYITHIARLNDTSSYRYPIINDNRYIFLSYRIQSQGITHYTIFDTVTNSLITSSMDDCPPLSNSFKRYTSFYDEKSNYIYYKSGSDLYKFRYGEEKTSLGRYTYTSTTINYELSVYYYEGSNFTIRNFTTLRNSSTNTNYAIYQDFTATLSYQITKTATDISNSITDCSINLSDSSNNPSLSSTYIINPDNDEIKIHSLINDFNSSVIRFGRLIEVIAYFPTGDTLTIFTGKTSDSAVKGNEYTIQAYGGLDKLKYTIPGFTNPQNNLTAVMKNIILRHPQITEADLDFDEIGIQHPSQIFDKATVLEDLEGVAQYYPEVSFYYSEEGKYCLKKADLSNPILEVSEDIILKDSLTIEEIPLEFNILKVTSTDRLDEEIIVEIRNQENINLFYEERVSEISSEVHKTKSQLEDYAIRYFNYQSSRKFRASFTVNGIIPLPINSVITLDAVTNGIPNTVKWVVKEISISLSSSGFTTSLVLETYIGD